MVPIELGIILNAGKKETGKFWKREPEKFRVCFILWFVKLNADITFVMDRDSDTDGDTGSYAEMNNHKKVVQNG